MIRLRPTAASGRLSPAELVSLDERLGLLLVVRLGVVGAVVAAAALAPSLLGAPAAPVRLAGGAYLVVAVAAEWLARRHDNTRLMLHRLLIPVDTLFAVWAVVPAGGAIRVGILLLAVHVVAVTLLASARSGVRVAAWDGFLLATARAGITVDPFTVAWGSRSAAGGSDAGTIAAGVGLVVLAACTGAFAALSERELRRAKLELTELATMAAELDQVLVPDAILERLLAGVAATFRVDGAVAVWEHPGGLLVRATGAASSGPPPEAGWADATAGEAWQSRRAALVRQLDAERDPTLARLLPGARNVVVLPLGPHGDHRGVVAVAMGPSTRGLVARRSLVALGQFAVHAALALRNARLLAEREELARRDALTGLANRRALDEILAAEIARARRSGDPLSLVVLDIDHFKRVNDSLGHQAGDEVLRTVAEVLSHSVRVGDTAARFGGEEFALVLPACGPDGALRVAEAARRAVSACPQLDGVTISGGLATLPNQAADGPELLRAADEALYRSKEDGRDRVTVAGRFPAAPAGPGEHRSPGAGGAGRLAVATPEAAATR